jgi:hypothetical protein
VKLYAVYQQYHGHRYHEQLDTLWSTPEKAEAYIKAKCDPSDEDMWVVEVYVDHEYLTIAPEECLDEKP